VSPQQLCHEPLHIELREPASICAVVAMGEHSLVNIPRAPRDFPQVFCRHFLMRVLVIDDERLLRWSIQETLSGSKSRDDGLEIDGDVWQARPRCD